MRISRDENLIDVIKASLPDGFIIREALKPGAQGSVFFGSYEGVEAAIKVFNPDDRIRAEREIELLKASEHQNIVRIIASSGIEVKGEHCIVVAYEYFPLGDIESLTDPVSPSLDLETLSKIGLDIGGAIEYIWKRRVVHRDVKPENIFKRDENDYILGDFGIASHLSLAAITTYGRIIGTDGYMSPEQNTGRKELTIHSDIFSLGVTMYELSTKCHPYNGRQADYYSRAGKPLMELRPDLPRQFCSLVHDMLNIAPARRPKNISQQLLRIMEE